MGKKPKTSRKGKKAWRANISTEDFEDHYEKSTKDALSGGSLAGASNDSLFFVDKSRDIPVKRKIEKSRDKVLRVDSMLQRNHFVKPVPSSIQNKKTSKKNCKAVQTAEDAALNSLKNEDATASSMVDLWGEKGEGRVKTKKKSKKCTIPAVEIEHSGCSFNPHPDSHQDALALAVAEEMHKTYKKDLEPERIPLTVPGEAMDEEEKYFLDAGEATDDDDDDQNEMADNGDADLEKRPVKKRRITRVKLNRRARQKERLKAEAEANKIGELSKEIDSIPDIIKEIAKEDEEQHNRHLRRAVAKQDRLKTRPSRMGKYKFDPAPMQVLLSEEKTGSLRQLKGCCTLVKDRFKSLEKRGLVIPTRKSSRK